MEIGIIVSGNGTGNGIWKSGNGNWKKLKQKWKWD